MCSAIVHEVLVAVHGRQAPSNSDWRAYVGLWLANAERVRSNLVVTAGGGPSPQQRTEISKHPNINSFATAVVSDSMLVRGIVTAISWSGKPIKAFSPREMELALGYLETGPDTRAKVLLEVAAMKSKLGIQSAPENT
jgi:hypothetical protein